MTRPETWKAQFERWLRKPCPDVGSLRGIEAELAALLHDCSRSAGAPDAHLLCQLTALHRELELALPRLSGPEYDYFEELSDLVLGVFEGQGYPKFDAACGL